MDAFDQREQGFEARDAHERDIRFKALSRRDKRLGLWIAELSGSSGAEAEAQARAFAATRVGVDDEPGLVAALGAALARANIEMSEHRIRRKIAETMAIVMKEISG